MRAVLDSNVLISAALTSGTPHRIVLAWLEREAFELIISESLLDEVATVLTERDHLRRWISGENARLYVERISTTAHVREDPPAGPSLTRDPDDDFVIHVARASKADVIVSGDSDLLDWPEQEPPVVTPETRPDQRRVLNPQLSVVEVPKPKCRAGTGTRHPPRACRELGRRELDIRRKECDVRSPASAGRQWRRDLIAAASTSGRLPASPWFQGVEEGSSTWRRRGFGVHHHSWSSR